MDLTKLLTELSICSFSFPIINPYKLHFSQFLSYPIWKTPRLYNLSDPALSPPAGCLLLLMVWSCNYTNRNTEQAYCTSSGAPVRPHNPSLWGPALFLWIFICLLWILLIIFCGNAFDVFMTVQIVLLIVRIMSSRRLRKSYAYLRIDFQVY